jgi:4-hydroxybenzoate polyprenyltransferase/phosphoserine phosphatase
MTALPSPGDPGRWRSPPALRVVPGTEAAPEVLFVDLDGTLVATDLFHEGLCAAVKRAPGLLLRLPRLAWQGRAALKQGVASRVALHVERLPYRAEVVDFLRQEKARGTLLVLATAADGVWARAVADHLGLFDGVLASDGKRNLRGAEKLRAIEAVCADQGLGGFGYLGDSRADLPVWQRASRVFVVEPSPRLLRELPGLPTRVFGRRSGRVGPAVRALRPHQWAKNVLVFLPLLLAHVLNPAALAAAVLAFVVLSLCASAIYLVNDLLDIEADRQHPTKRFRPFAAGRLPVAFGLPAALGLLGLAGLLTALALPAPFAGTVAVYLGLTTLYSCWIKRELVADVITLSGLYTLRLFAGGLATGVPVSEWLLAFAMFFFTSLAFVKRYTELRRMSDQGKAAPEGRSYLVTDAGLLESLGTASGYLAVLVFALYINGDVVNHLYRHPAMLWLICPLLVYWITRVWFLARRGQVADDPLLFAFRDRVSWVAAALTVCLVVLAAV